MPPASGPAVPTARAVPPERRGRPAGAARSTVERGAARLSLVLDRRRRMGEGSAARVAPGGRPRDRRLEGWGGRPWGVAIYDEMTRSEAVGTLVLTNTPSERCPTYARR